MNIVEEDLSNIGVDKWEEMEHHMNEWSSVLASKTLREL